ncbi:MAG: hypothetical protein J5499_05630 [Lachnospiraceae bacterium]|nr:hypothetical protein [Lachnospiraceae bacterium]MBO4762883.1 hypothetical protein [Lachnospiraceae bacterium]
MAINSIIGSASSASAKYEEINISIKKTTVEVNSTDAAVFTKTADEQPAEKNKLIGKPADPETIERLKAEADERFAQLKGIVEKLLLKQGGTFDVSNGLASAYRSLEVDPETQAQAQADIAEDGYWGVEQTSDRILDFAKALAGTDPDMAEKMLEAIKEGFKQAGEAWGEDLPELCQDTMKASLQKVEDWIASLKNPQPAETEAAPATEA